MDSSLNSNPFASGSSGSSIEDDKIYDVIVTAHAFVIIFLKLYLGRVVDKPAFDGDKLGCRAAEMVVVLLSTEVAGRVVVVEIPAAEVDTARKTAAGSDLKRRRSHQLAVIYYRAN